MSKTNNIYLQINDYNQSNDDIILMETSANRQTHIIDKANDFVVKIAGMTVPVDSVPILFFNENSYEVKLSFDGVTVSEFLLYIPPNTEEVGNLSGNIFQSGYIVKSLNNAMQLCYDALLILKPLLPTLGPPFVTIESGELNIYGEFDYNGTVDLIFDKNLIDLFNCFESFQLSVDNYLIKFVDRILNTVNILGVDYYKMLQNYPIFAKWDTFDKLLIGVSDIPVNDELVAGQLNVRRQIISDIQINDIVNRSENFIFKTIGTVRIANMTNDLPIRRYKINFDAELDSGEIIPLYLSPLHGLQLTLSFQERGYNLINEIVGEDN